MRVAETTMRGTTPGRPATGTDAQFGDGVAEQGGDDATDEERDPHRRTGQSPRLAQEGEDPGADHRADAQEDGTAQRHLPDRMALGALVAGHVVSLTSYCTIRWRTAAQVDTDAAGDPFLEEPARDVLLDDLAVTAYTLSARPPASEVTASTTSPSGVKRIATRFQEA